MCTSSKRNETEGNKQRGTTNDLFLTKYSNKFVCRVYFKGGQEGAFAPPTNLVAPPRNLFVAPIYVQCTYHNIILLERERGREFKRHSYI